MVSLLSKYRVYLEEKGVQQLIQRRKQMTVAAMLLVRSWLVRLIITADEPNHQELDRSSSCNRPEDERRVLSIAFETSYTVPQMPE